MKGIEEKQIETYLSTGELMDALSISRSTINRLVKRGLPHIWVGSIRRFPLQEIIKWLKNDQLEK